MSIFLCVYFCENEPKINDETQITWRQFSVYNVILNGLLNDASIKQILDSQRWKKKITKRIHFHFRPRKPGKILGVYLWHALQMDTTKVRQLHYSGFAKIYSKIYIIKINFLSAFLFVNHVA